MRTRKTTVILISGKAHAGKTTVKEIVLKKLGEIDGLRLFPYSFANPIKYIAKAFGGWNGEKDDAGREFLQDIGRVFRKYRNDIFCGHLINQLDKSNSMFPPHFVVVDDWRFENEARFFKDNPVFDLVTIRLFGRGGLEGELGNDVSENDLPEADTEYIGLEKSLPEEIYWSALDNSCSMDELETKIGEVVTSLSKNYIVE